MGARFEITRSRDMSLPHSWALHDHRAGVTRVQRFASREQAVRAMDDRVRAERGMPPRIPVTSAEVLEAMGANP